MVEGGRISRVSILVVATFLHEALKYRQKNSQETKLTTAGPGTCQLQGSRRVVEKQSLCTGEGLVWRAGTVVPATGQLDGQSITSEPQVARGMCLWCGSLSA